MRNKTNYLYVAVWLLVFTILELFLYPHLDLGNWRVWGLLTLMGSKALMVALVYMNLRQEGWALRLAFFAPIPVAIYFLLFMLYDAAYLWKS
ncbi:MAG: cytochrome C oxidase subunit IV family protein [Candidatus Omnitrophica bacterium]|nr:cytochrome C oxidase subunit IV family protein [Candidatus Omnitrophota bacterium]